MGFQFQGIQWSDYWLMLDGAMQTIRMTLAAAVLATVLGFLIGLLKMSERLIIRIAVATFTDIVRCIPLLVKVTLIYAGIGILGIKVSVFTAGTVALSLSSASYISEIVKDAFLTVPVQMRKAARGLGMNAFQEHRYIIFPLGLRQAFPSWLGIVIGIVKDTSVVAVIGYIELLKATQNIITRTQEPLPLLGTAAVFYFCICFPLSLAGRRLEAHLSKGDLV